MVFFINSHYDIHKTILYKKTPIWVSVIKQHTIPVTADRIRVSSCISFDFSPLWASDYVLSKHTILQDSSKNQKIHLCPDLYTVLFIAPICALFLCIFNVFSHIFRKLFRTCLNFIKYPFFNHGYSAKCTHQHFKMHLGA